jgi:FtsH-binding integral membrane protein
MELRPTQQNSYTPGSLQPAYAVSEAEGTLLRSVFGWMAIGLSVTALTAYAVVTNVQTLGFLFSRSVFLILMLVELGLVFYLSLRVHKLQASTASALFLGYSVLNGITLAPICLVYTSSSIASTFFVAAGTFASMAFIGSVTKRNLDSLGSFMLMGLVGLIIASLVSYFFPSDALNFILSVVGVFIFVGLTAYDTNKIKRMGSSLAADSEDFKRVAVIGALTLYLDFINLFIHLLRLLGDRRE